MADVQQYEAQVPKDQLTLHPENPRDGDIGAIYESILHHGFYGTLLVQRSTGHICAGNHRYLAGVQAGLETFPVIWLDIDDDAARRIMLVDNRTSDLAANKDQDLAEILEALLIETGSLGGTGYDSDDLDDLLASLEGMPLVGDEDVPGLSDELAEKWATESGQLWQIGKHRLLCANCTDQDAVQRLCGDDRPHSIVTDPPYGVDYGAKTRHLNKFNHGRARDDIGGDHGSSDLRALLKDAFMVAGGLLNQKNTAYVFMAGANLHVLRAAMEQAGFKYSQFLVWVKNSIVLGRQDYNFRHEFIFYGWRGTHKFYGPPARETVLEFNRPSASDLHPTMKPVDLLCQLIQDGSPPGGIIYDPFCGSGSTLVACELTGRSGLGVEIDPGYVAVTLERLRDNGLVPELVDEPVYA